MNIKRDFISLNGYDHSGNFNFILTQNQFRFEKLRFAPNNWIQQTNLDKINIDKIYVPFWNYSLQGSIQSNIRLSRVTHVKVCSIDYSIHKLI